MTRGLLRLQAPGQPLGRGCLVRTPGHQPLNTGAIVFDHLSGGAVPRNIS